MGYRKLEHPHRPHGQRTVQDTTTPGTIFIQNGATGYFAFPCWYLEVPAPVRWRPHNRPHHDHIGWPDPQHPDHSCQDHDFHLRACTHHDGVHGCDGHQVYLDQRRVSPIHLLKEGYEDIEIALDEAPQGLTVVGHIDATEDWVVRVDVKAMCPDAIKEKVEARYTVYAIGDIDGKNVRDVVARGKLVILPNPIS